MALYHDIRYAVAIMMKMPNALTAVCSSGPPDDSAMMNCAGEGEKHAKTEDFQRMLTAADGGLQDRRLQAGPVCGG